MVDIELAVGVIDADANSPATESRSKMWMQQGPCVGYPSLGKDLIRGGHKSGERTPIFPLVVSAGG
jgi:hypothetical protein